MHQLNYRLGAPHCRLAIIELHVCNFDGNAGECWWSTAGWCPRCEDDNLIFAAYCNIYIIYCIYYIYYIIYIWYMIYDIYIDILQQLYIDLLPWNPGWALGIVMSTGPWGILFVRESTAMQISNTRGPRGKEPSQYEVGPHWSRHRRHKMTRCDTIFQVCWDSVYTNSAVSKHSLCFWKFL